MRGLQYFLATLFITFSLNSTIFAEQCPTIGQLQGIFNTANPLTSDGKMPYPVDIDDPEFSPDGTWFVASHLDFSNRGPATPFIAFCMFLDPAGTSGPSLTTADVIARCKSDIDAASDTSTTVDYPHAYIGDDEATGISYYFDVCLFAGSFSPAIGTADIDIQQDANLGTSLPDIVMADLSPLTSSLLKQYLKTHHFHKVTN